MAGQGVVMAVASNKGGPQLAMALERYGLDQCFRVSVGTGRDYPAKPDPAVYERVIAPGVGLDPGERPSILMVGDTDTDLVFGRNIGADLCWCALRLRQWPGLPVPRAGTRGPGSGGYPRAGRTRLGFYEISGGYMPPAARKLWESFLDLQTFWCPLRGSWRDGGVEKLSVPTFGLWAVEFGEGFVV